MSDSLKDLGRRGEELARDYLKNQGFRILEKNFFARRGEIDLIAQEGRTICFVEVKMRTTQSFGSGVEAVSWIKQKKIIKAAYYYLSLKKRLDAFVRFDVVSIYWPKRGSCQIDLFRNAFECDDY